MFGEGKIKQFRLCFLQLHYAPGTKVDAHTGSLILHITTAPQNFVEIWSILAVDLEEAAAHVGAAPGLWRMQQEFRLSHTRHCATRWTGLRSFGFAVHAHEHALSVRLKIWLHKTDRSVEVLVPSEHISRGGKYGGTLFEVNSSDSWGLSDWGQIKRLELSCVFNSSAPSMKGSMGGSRAGSPLASEMCEAWFFVQKLWESTSDMELLQLGTISRDWDDTPYGRMAAACVAKSNTTVSTC